MSHVALDELIAWWLGELPEAREPSLEEHFFACAECTERAQSLAGLAGGIRDAVRRGTVELAVSAAFLEAMKKANLRLREYRVAPGGSVQCTIRADDDAIVSRLQAPLAGVRRLDLLRVLEGGEVERMEDIPFDPDSDEVFILPSAAAVRAMPSVTFRTRLLAVDEAGERMLGEYTFVHTADTNSGSVP